MLRIVFFGIHQIGAESLTRLLEFPHCRIELVVTKPGTHAQPQLVQQLAGKCGLQAVAPETPKDPRLLSMVAELAPDLIAVGGYHKVLPAALLDIPRLGVINLHASLLPAYRGPVPWKWAIMHGLEETGVTVHRMQPKLDSGEILASRKVAILADDTGGSLFARLSGVGGELLAETVTRFAEGELKGVAQDEAAASYFSYPDESQTRVKWDEDAAKIRDLIRALDPSPGAWGMLAGRRVRFFGAKLTRNCSGAPAGTVVEVNAKGVLIATLKNDLLVNRLAFGLDHSSEQFREPPSPRVGEVFL